MKKYSTDFPAPKFIRQVFDRKWSRAEYMCACGKPFVTSTKSVEIGRTKSCGCHRKQMLVERSTVHGDAGGSRNYLYGLWCGIKARCLNPNNHAYKNYGGRGINIYKEWTFSYPLFKEYVISTLGERPEGCSMDRINNDGNYEPCNLRWASNDQQGRNTRTSMLSRENVLDIKRLLIKNELSCREIGLLYGVSKSTIQKIKSNKIHRKIILK